MAKKINKSDDLRVKGALKQERNVIGMLLLICGFAFLLSIITQYIFPLCLSVLVLEVIHYEFLVNVFLGIACSALISLVCLWKPFVLKKEYQHSKLIALVKRVFFDYEKLLSVIDCNRDRNDKENTYLGEHLLIDAARKLEEDSNNLVCEYEKSDVVLKNIEKIIDGINSCFIPTTQVVLKFFDLIMPKEYKDNPNDLFFVNKNESFDREENIELYNQLRMSLEGIISFEDLINLFSDYINPNHTEFEVLRNNTLEQLQQMQKHIKQKKIFFAQNKLFVDVINIQNKFSNKRMAERIKNIEEEQKQCKQKRN